MSHRRFSNENVTSSEGTVFKKKKKSPGTAKMEQWVEVLTKPGDMELILT